MGIAEIYRNLDNYHFGFTAQLVIVILGCTIYFFRTNNKKEKKVVLILAIILTLFLIYDVITEYIK